MADEPYYPGKHLAEITRRCQNMTVGEMLRNVDEVRRKNRLGFGHYFFDGRHAPQEDWSVPGALDFDVVQDDQALEVIFTTAPFTKEELTVHVEEGMLDVEAVHVETDPDTDEERRVRMTKAVPVPIEFDLESVEAKFEKGKLIVSIPRPTRPRVKVDIE